MAEEAKFNTAKFLLGLVLVAPGAWMLVMIMSNEDRRRTVHEMWQPAARGQISGAFVGYSVVLLLMAIGFWLLRSASK